MSTTHAVAPFTEAQETLGRWLMLCSSSTGKALDNPVVVHWVTKFKKYPAEKIHQAFDSWTQHNRSFPTVADILQEINRLEFGGWIGAWIRVCEAARAQKRTSTLFYVVFEHPAIHFAVQSLGGLADVGKALASPTDMGYLKRDFKEAFMEYRTGGNYPPGLGYFMGQNVILVGNPERACEVFKGGTRPSQNADVQGIGAMLVDTNSFSSKDHELPATLTKENFYRPPAPNTSPPSWMEEESEPIEY